MECTHYVRCCDVYCEKCEKYFPCHICHDLQVESHDFERESLNKIKCRKCLTEQEVKSQCIKCLIQFGKHSCLKCAIFSDQITFHCDTCKLCYTTTNNHNCKPKRIIEECSICLRRLLSQKKIVTLECKHDFHPSCLWNWVEKDSITCPLCRAPIGNKGIVCGLCEESFYGNPNGLKLDCGHWYHVKKCLENLQMSLDEETTHVSVQSCVCEKTHIFDVRS